MRYSVFVMQSTESGYWGGLMESRYLADKTRNVGGYTLWVSITPCQSVQKSGGIVLVGCFWLLREIVFAVI